MIIARSPLRISLGGGGTDLPSYYERFGGFLITAAIDKYVYITLHETFVPEFIIKYSKLERISQAAQIEHPIIRESFQMLGIDGGFLELTSMADIPAGTGLGSSGSFTTALLKALHAHKRNLIPNTEIAAQACEIEINRLKEPVGKQDQYIAALGGITCFNFNKDGSVQAWPAKISEDTRYNLEDNLVMFFTGYSRSAGSILKDQHEKSKQDDKAMLDNLHQTKEIGYASQRALEVGDLREFARLMDEHWQRKKARSGGMSNPKINEWYDLARASGALGGKLIGAGGGGFLMFYAEEDKSKLRSAMRKAGLKEVRFRFDFEGDEAGQFVVVDIANYPVAILAGGLATRLRPITEKVPKVLVPVAGQPFLAHQLALLRREGVRRAVLCLGHLGEMVEREFGEGRVHGVHLDYSFDGPVLLGTGGALKRALSMLDGKFFVLYGDSYLPILFAPIAEFFECSGKLGLMTVYRNEGKYDTSNVVFGDGEIKVYDKKQRLPEMRHIDYGLSLFRAEVFDRYPSDKAFDLADVMRDLVAEHQLAGYEVKERFYEIGSHAGLDELNILLAAPGKQA